MIRASITALALAGGLLSAQAPPMHGPEGMRPEGPERILKALGLSRDQEQAIHAVLDKHRPAAMALRKAAEAKEEAVRAGLEDPALTEAQVRALHAAASEARLQEFWERRAATLEISALLTPEQRAKNQRIRDHQRQEREAQRALREDLGEPEGRPGPPR